MSYNTFQWSFIGVAALTIILIILAALGIISGWVIAIAIFGGFGGEIASLCYWRKDYIRRY